MRANRGTASNVIAFKPARERQAKIVAAVRVVSIDYRSIVESAVDALVHNTAAARHEVYTQARGIVRRHLQLMRLPAPIVEVEKLALDLTIRKIERQWRSRQSAEAALPDMPEELELEEAAPDMPVAPRGAFLRAVGSAVVNVVLRPLFTLVWALLLPVRLIARFATSPIGFAAVIPFTIMAILIVYFADETATYKKFVGEPAGRLISSLDVHTSTPRGRNKSADRVGAAAKANTAEAASTTASPPLPSPPAAPAFQLAGVTSRAATDAPTAPAPPAFKTPPMRTAAVTPVAAIAALPLAVADLDELPATAETPTASESPPYRGATRIRPVRAAFPGLLASSNAPAARVAMAAPGTPANPCDALPLAERIACATKDAAAPDTTAVNFDSRPKWLSGYAVVRDIMTPRPPTPPAPAAAKAAAPAPAAALAPAAAAATAPAASDAKAGATAVAAVAPANQSDEGPAANQPGNSAAAPKTVIRPANPKLAALLESGRKWSTKGDLDRAAHDFSEAIRVDPKYPDSYAERGQVMFKMGETERAIADYTAAIQRDPQHGSAMRSRGMAYLYRGSSDLALTDLTHAIELAEKDPTALAPIELFYARRSRASLYDAKQQWDREIGDCTALIDAQTNDPTVAEVLKQNYGEAGAANVLAGIYRQRATTHIRQSEWEAAIEDLTAAVPLSADRGFAALMDRSKLHEARGQREEAIADLQTALAARPGSEEVRLALRRLGAAPRPPPGAF
jgi:tetratricopeptide (TPR) repeat protein